MRPQESYIGQPVRSLQTMLRVIALDDDRFQIVIPDGIYGPSTVNAVTDFQQLNGIPVTGITDQRTWDTIVKAYEEAIIRAGKPQYIEVLLDPGKIIKQGEKDPHVYLVQSMLTQLADDYGIIARPTHSGIMDSDTVTSLESFQKLTDLPITGEVDRLTWNHLTRQFTLSMHRNVKRNSLQIY